MSYYFTEIDNEPIYCSLIHINKAIETSLYRGNKLVLRKSLHVGKHQLSKEEFSLNVRVKWFKSIPELKINNELIVLEKISRKQLQNKLIHYNIHNELNPRKLPKKSFNYKSLKTPAILLVIGLIWDVLSHGKGKFWEFPAMILYFIAYFQLSSPLINKIPDRVMDLETKGKLKFVAGIIGMGVTQTLVYYMMS